MSDTARAIVAVAVVLLAAVAAPRVALDFAPHGAAPEVVALLNFPSTGGGDPVDVTTRYVLPLESAIRSLGDVVSTQGEVSSIGASMTIRFHRGTDPELKAARLSSELASLRAKLPEGTHVNVWPSTDRGAEPSAIIALTDHDASRAAERVADDLRATPGVREVTTYGATTDEVDVRTFGSAPAGLAGTIRRALTPHLVGTRVLSSAGATRVGDVRVNGQRLDAIAGVRERRSELQNVARVGGREAVVLLVVRDDDVSLFDFDRAVHATLRGHGTRDIENDAADLRALLLRVLLGAAVASLVLAFAGRPLLAAYVPLAFAVLINICSVASIRVDALSLLAVCAAIACMAPVAVWRAVNRGGLSSLVVAACFAQLPLIATSLASDSLAAILTLPARLFALGSLAALAAAAILPPGTTARAASGRLERRLLRASASIVLAAVACTMFLLSWFGDRLDPRQRTRTPDRSRLQIRIGLPAGTPLAPTLATLTRVERALHDVEGLEHVWSYAGPGRANVLADVTAAFQRPIPFELLRLRVEAAMPLGGGAVRVEQSYASGAAVLSSNEEQPAADEQATMYRMLLKGTDANAMRRAVESLTTRLAQQGIHRNSVRAEWPEATTQLTLVPRAGVTPETAAQLAAALRERSYTPLRSSLPDGRALVAASLEAPVNEDDVPSAADLFSRPMPIPADAAFEVQREPVSGRVTRELGRFVLPITVNIDGYALEERQSKRVKVDRALSLMRLPAGLVLERPPLTAWDFSREKLRLFGLAALLPSLLFALAAVVLSSIRRALLALAPALVGVACISPALLAASASMDEVVLLIAGAAVCCVTALSTVALLQFTGVAAMYRVLRHAFVPCAIGTVAGATMLFLASTAGRGLGEVWRAPLLAAAVVLAGGFTAIVLPAALVSFRPWRGIADAPAAATVRFAGGGTLAVRNLTKVYGGSFRALHGVSFELEPGVVGLLGPNGAGKTTLLRILTGLLLPTRGVVRYAGVDVRPETLPAYRERIGFLPQEFNAYAGLTAAQFLDYWALERGIASTSRRRTEVERLLAVARLEAHAGRKLRDFSGGMRQRIGIARALIGDPPLLVVDEPTTGLDIEARAHFRELITSLAKERTIILSTHIASDVEATAARLLLLSHGRLVWDGTPEALIARADGRVFETVADDGAARELTRLHHITTRVRLAGGVRLRGITAAGGSLPGTRAEATLEEAYLAEIAPRERRAAGSFAFVYGGASSTSNDT